LIRCQQWFSRLVPLVGHLESLVRRLIAPTKGEEPFKPQFINDAAKARELADDDRAQGAQPDPRGQAPQDHPRASGEPPFLMPVCRRRVCVSLALLQLVLLASCGARTALINDEPFDGGGIDAPMDARSVDGAVESSMPDAAVDASEADAGPTVHSGSWIVQMPGVTRILDLEVLPDESVVVLGELLEVEPEGRNVWVARLHLDGRILWQLALGSLGLDFATDLILTSDDRLVVSVVSSEDESCSAGIVTLDQDGSLIDQFSLPELDFCYMGVGTMAPTRDGGFVLPIAVDEAGARPAILRLDGGGEVSWARLLSVETSVQTRVVALDDGRLLVSAFDDITMATVLLWLSANGEVEEVRSIDLEASSVVATAEGGVAVYGLRHLPDRHEAILASLDRRGDLLSIHWIHAGLETAAVFSLIDVASRPSGGFVVTGQPFDAREPMSHLFELDADGSVSWAQAVAADAVRAVALGSSSVFFAGHDEGQGLVGRLTSQGEPAAPCDALTPTTVFVIPDDEELASIDVTSEPYALSVSGPSLRRVDTLEDQVIVCPFAEGP